MNISDDDFRAISSVVYVVIPVKLVVEAICRGDASLITADASINFMIESLLKYDEILRARNGTCRGRVGRLRGLDVIRKAVVKSN